MLRTLDVVDGGEHGLELAQGGLRPPGSAALEEPAVATLAYTDSLGGRADGRILLLTEIARRQRSIKRASSARDSRRDVGLYAVDVRRNIPEESGFAPAWASIHQNASGSRSDLRSMLAHFASCLAHAPYQQAYRPNSRGSSNRPKSAATTFILPVPTGTGRMHHLPTLRSSTSRKKSGRP